MKTKTITAVLLCILMSLTSVAQDKKQRGNHESIITYKTELWLNDEQVEQIKAIQKEYMPKIKEARNAEDRETLKKLNDERKAKVEQLLTPEQLTKWKALIEKKKAERQNPELKQELRNYHKQNIQPVLIEKRKEFDKELSDDEKQIIADVRAKRQAFNKSARDMDFEDKMMRSKELRQEAHKTLKPIIEKHKPGLEKIKEELKSSQQQWEKDMDAIKAKYITGYKHDNAKRNKDLQMAIHFLLMDMEKK